MRHLQRRQRQGLTVIEVLVAIVLLAIVSTAILASLTTASRLNRAAATDVDYSRVVRSVMERVGVVWSNTDGWQGTSTTATTADTEEEIRTFVSSLNPDCTANVLEPSDAGTVTDVSTVVRVLEISCQAPTQDVAQVFQLEFGAP